MSDPIPIVKSGFSLIEDDERPPDLFDLETLVDFDDLDPETLLALTDKSQVIGGEVAKNQLSTQSHVISLCGRNRKGTFPTLRNPKNVNLSSLRGGQFFVPESTRLIKISEKAGVPGAPFVISEICHTTVIDFDCIITQLIVTNSHNIVIRMKKAPIAGIECINSSNIIIDADSCNFVRAITSSDVKVNGECDGDVLLDMRNCIDVFVNGEKIEVGMYTEGRFSFSPQDKSFLRLEKKHDIYRVGGSDAPDGGKQMPNLTFLKSMKTGKYASR